MTKEPIYHEMVTIHKAGEAYESSNGKDRMHNFVAAFTCLHNVSMVAYTVGMHNDTFKNNQESLENKVLFCIPLFDKDNRGQGGSIIGLHFVFALLDW